LTLDGVPLGAGAFRAALAPGRHELRAEEVGYLSATTQVDGAQGGAVRLELRIDAEHPRWPKPKPPPVGDFFIESSSGVPLMVVTGGAPSAACEDECSVDAPIGARALLRGGWTSRLGGGVAVEVGSQFTQTGFSDRPETLNPIGLAPLRNDGVVQESIRHAAFLVGVSGHYRKAGRWPWVVRLGAGFSIGGEIATRRGTFESSAGAAYDAAQSSTDGATYVYLQPEVGVGYDLDGGLDVGISLAGAFHFAVSKPVWSNADIVPTSDDPLERGDGGAVFARDDVLGPVLFALVPSFNFRWQAP